MPPDVTKGWTIPQWLQIVALVTIIASPFVMPIILVFLNWAVKDKRTTTNQENQALVDDQATLIDKLMKSAEMAPRLLEELQRERELNIGLKVEVQGLSERVKSLEIQVEAIRQDRDAWREVAQEANKEVPHLKGQLATYEKMLNEKMVELDRVKEERDFALQMAANSSLTNMENKQNESGNVQ